MTRATRRILSLVVTLLVIGGGIAGFLMWQKKHAPAPVTYKSETVQKRKITARITATGTLQATVTVLVGTQISGRVAKLFADYNSKVTKGELVAKIDPQLFDAALLQARAEYAQNQAAVAKAIATEKNNEVQYNRTVALNKQSLAATADVEAAQTAVTTSQADVNVAKANLVQAQAQLSQAQTNLDYTNIISPIDGVVISRSVDVGQTVAASLSAPTIFTIAEDLKKMQVNTNVSEGDVGRLDAGQTTSFTVDAFPGRTFKGIISQIRNSATTVSNVVTYDAVIDVDNSDLKLRPGMTANVNVTYAERDDAVAVPNSALRFHPPGDVLAMIGGGGSDDGGKGTKGHRYVDGGAGRMRGDGGVRRFRSDGGAGGGSGGHYGQDGGGSANASVSDGGRLVDGGFALPANDDSGSDDGVTLESRTLYVLRNDQPVAVDVVLGLSDGSYTEVVSGDLHENDQIIVDATVNGKATTASSGGGKSNGGPPRMF